MAERKHFGTDGIRGKVGEGAINPTFVLQLGWAAGVVFAREGRGKVTIGKDTRISGYMFESVLESGLTAAGIDTLLLGPMPTPAIAYLTRTFHAQAGIVISASHNGFQDNGIKFFSANGEKLPDEIELAIEEQLEKPMTIVAPDKLGKATRVVDAAGRYIEFCKRAFPDHLDLKDFHLVIDCAHGATYNVAPAVFTELGAKVTSLGVEPDGLNINASCGSTSPQMLREKVLQVGADLGIAYDGDGDRLIMVDDKGELVDGDELICIIACDRQARNCLGGGVVGTLMSNLGLEHGLAKRNIDFARAGVGDRYVMEMLKDRGWQLGGENSGHIICLDRTTTGDGIIATLQVLTAIMNSGKNLHELKRHMVKYPQVLINVPSVEGFDPDQDDRVLTAIRETELELADRGRVLLRKSGTEPLIRVMAEGQDDNEIHRVIDYLVDVVKSSLEARV